MGPLLSGPAQAQSGDAHASSLRGSNPSRIARARATSTSVWHHARAQEDCRCARPPAPCMESAGQRALVLPTRARGAVAPACCLVTDTPLAAIHSKGSRPRSHAGYGKREVIHKRMPARWRSVIEPLSLNDRASTASAESVLQASLVQTQQWMNLVEMDQRAAGSPTLTGMGRVGVDGPGFLAFDNHGRRVLARDAVLTLRSDGYIVNDRGAVLLGYPGAASGDPTPLQVDPKASADVQVDDSGRIILAVRPSRASPDRQPIIIGRIAVALPPYPDEAVLEAQSVSQGGFGVPLRFFPAGTVHVGRIQRNPPVVAPGALRDTIRALWTASGRGEIEAAVAASSDAAERTALNLVR